MALGRYRYNNLVASYDDPASGVALLARQLGLPVEALSQVEILRKSLDARHKPRLAQVLSLAFTIEERLLPRGDPQITPHEDPALPPLPAQVLEGRPIVVGAGPAGQFAALGLAARGYRPLVLERGRPIAERRLDVRRLWLQRVLDPDSNVQFGEGGAGTFSDGKLTSRNSNWFTRQVLRWFSLLGARDEVIYSHLPHVGTDGIRRVSSRLRQLLEQAGAEFVFSARVTQIESRDGRVLAVRLADGRRIETSTVILAVGHSARDTAQGLHQAGVAMELKSFAMGLRIEHPRDMIDLAQYGRGCRLDLTGAATYKLVTRTDGGSRGLYSFCMCPGGMVVLAASEEGRLVVNGMSWSARRMPWSNAAMVAQVDTGDLRRWAAQWGLPDSPLVGHHVQQHLEALSFREGGGDWSAPAQRAADFCRHRPSRDLPASSYRPSLCPTRLERVFPPKLAASLAEGLQHFDRSIRGFLDEGLLIAPETRTSSPLRLTRDADVRHGVNLAGFYPVGEGAGYSGGIVSSAADGLRTALGFRQEGPSLVSEKAPEQW